MAESIDRTALGKDEIRVLVHDDCQSRASGLLACQTSVLKLSHAQVGTGTSYAALSYVWGDAAITQPLICDGKKISVTTNLHNALSSLWSAHPTLKIWADALSITQDNIFERNHQVSLMGNIYRYASCVFVFIGPPLEGGNRFWDFLKSIDSDEYAIGDNFEDELDEFLEGQANDLAKGYHDLINRPWFTRAWTYQEIRLAADAKIVCGSSMGSWNSFMASLLVLKKRCLFMRSFASLRTFLGHQYFWIENSNAKQDANSSQDVTPNQMPDTRKSALYDTLVAEWRRDSSDARDKIYAFTSPLLVSSRYTEITPNYALDMRSLFIRFIRVYINNENNLIFLLNARGVDEPVWFPEPGFQHRILWSSLPKIDHPSKDPLGLQMEVYSPNVPDDTKELSQDDGLPSWVCDWRKEGCRPVADIGSTMFFDMLKSVRPCRPLRQSVYDYSNRLILMGYALARVGSLQVEASTIIDERLGKFSRLPKCGLQKAIGESACINKHSQFSDCDIRSEARQLPKSSMVILLLQTMLHDRIWCKCDGTTNQDLLEAHCTPLRFPRSNVKFLDWLFLLDGLSVPVVLRPHVIPGPGLSDRGEVGFEFVSALPLEAQLDKKKWIQSPFAYGEVCLY